jgi:Lipocalin-like domain
MKTIRIAKVPFASALISLLGAIPLGAWAEEGAGALVGSWKLTAWTVRVVDETEDKEPFGPNPKGRACAAFTRL